MNAPHRLSPNRNRIADLAVIAFALAALSGSLYFVETPGCHLLRTLGWIAFEVLRPFLLTAWQSAPVHLCLASGPLPHLLHVSASMWPLLCALVG